MQTPGLVLPCAGLQEFDYVRETRRSCSVQSRLAIFSQALGVSTCLAQALYHLELPRLGSYEPGLIKELAIDRCTTVLLNCPMKAFVTSTWQ